MWLYELIEDRHPDLVLAHPLKTKAIASARIKTDKIDATTLAHLLRADLVPAAYIPPRAVRDTREILRYRASLVRLRTQVKNKIAAILSKNGIVTPTKTAFGVKSRQFLATVAVRPCYRLALEGYLRQLAHLTDEITQAAQTIEAQAQADPEAQLLCTMPGIGAYSALLILSEIGNVHRFPDSRHLCSYAGLVPSVPSSIPRRGTRCSWSGSCRRAAPPSGAFRRCSPADPPVGALAHRGAPLGTTHSNCNGSKRRRSPADSSVRRSAPRGSHSPPTLRRRRHRRPL